MNERTRNLGASESLEARRFRSLIENSFDVFKIIDAQGTITYVSPSVERVMGFQPRELVGASAFDNVHPDDLVVVRRALDHLRGHPGEERTLQVRDRHKNGSWRTVQIVAINLLEDPAVAGIVLNCRDVTERIEWEEALKRSEERYQKAFHSSPDSITLSYVKDGVFLEVNEGFERITGFTRDEIIGKSSLELGIWSDPVTRQKATEILRRDGVVHDLQTEFKAKDGRIVVGRFSAAIIQLGDELCMLATVRDVTAQVRQQEELRRTTEQLQREHKELTEKNIALKQILEHIEEDKASYRHQVAASVENLLRPVITKLRETAGRLKPAEVDDVEARLNAIVKEDIDQFQNNLAKLTPRELDICELIQQGRTSKEIAQVLGLSPETIHKHRQAIRRKLQIDHRGINLSSYLRSR